MIRSFKCRQTEQLFSGGKCAPQWVAFERTALRRLDTLNQAADLKDLRSPGAHLEKLKGDRAGQWSVRINQQWRLCFVWADGAPHDVEIVDDH